MAKVVWTAKPNSDRLIATYLQLSIKEQPANQARRPGDTQHPVRGWRVEKDSDVWSLFFFLWGRGVACLASVRRRARPNHAFRFSVKWIRFSLLLPSRFPEETSWQLPTATEEADYDSLPGHQHADLLFLRGDGHVMRCGSQASNLLTLRCMLLRSSQGSLD